MSKRIIGVVAAVVLAGVGTALLVGFVRGAEERALAGEEPVDVLVVSELVEKGTPADELGDRVSTERVPAKVKAQGSIDDLGSLDGRVTSVALLPGEQLVDSRFLTPTQFDEESGIEVPEGLQEVTISVSPERAVGGQISPGDTVGFVASFGSAGEEEETSTKFILHKLLITNIQMEQLPQQTEDGADNDADLAPTGNLLITFAVDVPQVERMVFAAEHGSIWLTNEPEDADEGGSEIRTGGNIYDD